MLLPTDFICFEQGLQGGEFLSEAQAIIVIIILIKTNRRFLRAGCSQPLPWAVGNCSKAAPARQTHALPPKSLFTSYKTFPKGFSEGNKGGGSPRAVAVEVLGSDALAVLPDTSGHTSSCFQSRFLGGKGGKSNKREQELQCQPGISRKVLLGMGRRGARVS